MNILGNIPNPWLSEYADIKENVLIFLIIISILDVALVPNEVIDSFKKSGDNGSIL